jgi:ParB-like chromosome segregation protein Spo0J
MKVIVSQLLHHPLNAEIYSLSSLDDLISSIEEFGLLQPLVINQRNEVVSGNRRLEAIRRLGWEEVEVNVVSSVAEDEPKLIVHHNKQRVKTCKELLNEV